MRKSSLSFQSREATPKVLWVSSTITLLHIVNYNLYSFQMHAKENGVLANTSLQDLLSPSEILKTRKGATLYQRAWVLRPAKFFGQRCLQKEMGIT